MWIPLAVLAVLSAFGGFILERNEVFEKWLYPAPLPVLGELNKHPHHLDLMTLSITAAVLGILVGLLRYGKGLPGSEGFDLTKWASWRRGAANQFGYDNAVVTAGVEGGGDIATAIWKYFDVGIIDRTVNGVGVFARKVGAIFGSFQTGYVRTYALMMLFGAAGLLGYFVYAMTRVGGGQ